MSDDDEVVRDQKEEIKTNSNSKLREKSHMQNHTGIE